MRTARRALAPLCCSLALLSACGDDLLPPTPDPDPFPATPVGRVAIASRPPLAVQGRALALAAEVRAAGADSARLIAGYPLRWRSSDTAVVSIAGATATPKRAGRATVYAEAHGAADSFSVTVLAQGYRVTPLSTAGADTLHPRDVNDPGQVLLGSGRGSLRPRVYLWSAGTLAEITPANGGAGNKLNNRGQVAGGVRGADGVFRPAAWEAGQWTVLTGLPENVQGSGPNGPLLAEAIDERGRVAGGCGSTCAFVWEAGRATRLPLGAQQVYLDIRDMNAGGDVVGTGLDLGGSPGFTQALLWKAGAQAQVLTSNRGYLPTVATGINDAGRFTVNRPATAASIGGSRGPCGYEMCAWVQDHAGTITVLDGIRPFAEDLNATAVVVGSAAAAAALDAERRGWIWVGTRGMDLTALLADTAWVVTDAVAVNASGQVAARARNTATGAHAAVLLSPQ